MRTITVIPGANTPVTYTYKKPGAMRAVRLVHTGGSPRPPKGHPSGTGAGDRAWLAGTPFLTADLTDDSGDGSHRALFAIDADADAAEISDRLLRGMGDHCVAEIPEGDAEYVADGMRLPLLVITSSRQGRGFTAVYRKRRPPQRLS